MACGNKDLSIEGIEVQAPNGPNHYRLRAEEMRKIAAGLYDRKERKTLMDIALEYEELSLKRDVNDGHLKLANGSRKRPNGAAQKPD